MKPQDCQEALQSLVENIRDKLRFEGFDYGDEQILGRLLKAFREYEKEKAKEEEREGSRMDWDEFDDLVEFWEWVLEKAWNWSFAKITDVKIDSPDEALDALHLLGYSCLLLLASLDTTLKKLARLEELVRDYKEQGLVQFEDDLP